MKREIVHSTKDCEPKFKLIEIEGMTYASQANPYPGEHVKIMRGTAFRDYLCDYCGKEIKAGEQCSAVSIWADYGGIPYFPWESEFIQMAAKEGTK